jgi:enoyl-[acyl-carrier protein] reductase I
MLLEGKKGLVLNVTNKNSLGWGIADIANQHGAIVGIGAQNERLSEGVAKLIEGRERFVPLTVDFSFEEQYSKLRSQVESQFGKIDFLVHSVGFAPKSALENRFIETTAEDFHVAMSASAYSFVRLCREMEDLLTDDASVITLTYLGSTRAMPNYNVMGMCKAALESSVRYLALDLGVRGIRVNAVSPGPVNTVSGRGVKGLSGMISHVQELAPLKRPYAQPEVAKTSLYLLSHLSEGVSGQIMFVDSGYSVMAM